MPSVTMMFLYGSATQFGYALLTWVFNLQ